jgi:hypothetical protein
MDTGMVRIDLARLYPGSITLILIFSYSKITTYRPIIYDTSKLILLLLEDRRDRNLKKVKYEI